MKERQHTHRVQAIPDYKIFFCSHAGEIKASYHFISNEDYSFWGKYQFFEEPV
jgi:hypothetical protein